MVEDLLAAPGITDAERAAIALLGDYDGGFWIRAPGFRAECVRTDPDGHTFIDWSEATKLLNRVGLGRCDVAVLLTALHLGGGDVGGPALGPWWGFLTRDALANVLKAIAVAAGARAEVTDLGDGLLRDGPND